MQTFNVRLLASAAVLALAAAAAAQPVSTRAPYAGDQSRDIKSLSERQLQDLRSGAGMALSLPAELNGHPGPRHVIELADALQLTAEQRAAAVGIQRAMDIAAKAIGPRIIERESELDRRFASRDAHAADIASLTAEIAALWGELRAVHLRAHLQMTEQLTAQQIAAYDAARGYGHGAHSGTPRSQQ